MRIVKTMLAAALLTVSAGAASAASCGNDGAGFSAWLQDFKAQAQSSGVSARTVEAALGNVSYDRGTIQHDRAVRKAFGGGAGSLLSRASSSRAAAGKARMQRYAAVVQRTEARTGVPGPVIMAIWGLETDYGAVQGGKPIFTGLATLAYDCRRSEMFTKELLAALQIVDRGDLSIGEMRGAGHGELGQAQFLPSSYLKYATDGDGDGRRDLVRSGPDVIASIGTYLAGYGWSRGGGWEPGSANFRVFNEWNRSSAYQEAIALLATKIAAGTSATR
ncbi:lytic murein transglycosylase [Hansschlegelia plantiphila]|uniref:Lytic transglycosylase n=1 Tax=Hansschlegelia plantiphila TaxID=374655 RepID=A0A9W6MVQ2_9HYPH|nr:lytic murein transglycosylase [Hansschlegelia plantiphila]GLK68233.1 lytic transglycosylase [Hansschlegelia plantiphila]